MDFSHGPTVKNLGSVEFATLSLDTLDDDSVEWIRRRFEGEFDEKWLVGGCPVIHCEIEADEPTDALRKTYSTASTAADALSLRLNPIDATFSFARETGASIVCLAAVSKPSGAYTIFYEYHREQLLTLDTNAEMKHRVNKFNERVFPALVSKLPLSLFDADAGDETMRRLRRGLHWWSEAKQEKLVVAKFLLAWIALECLVTKTTDRVSGKSQIVRRRLAALANAHQAGTWAEADFDDLWELRCEVVHEAASGYFDPASKHSRSLASHLDLLQYLLTIALVHILDTANAASDLETAWDAIETYVPSTSVALDELPQRLITVDYVVGPDATKAEKLFQDHESGDIASSSNR